MVFGLLLAVLLTYFLGGGGVQYLFWTDRQTSPSVGSNDVWYGTWYSVVVVDSNPNSFFYEIVMSKKSISSSLAS